MSRYTMCRPNQVHGRNLLLIAAALSIMSAARAQTPTPFVLETDATYTTAFGDQFYGAITAGPGEYFAVWVDLRVGGANPAGYDLYGQRILPDGSLGAPGSLELLRDKDRMTTGIPAVAWNGTIYLVVWNEGSTLYAMRVSAAGEALDPAGFVIGTTSTSLRWPSVARCWGGTSPPTKATSRRW
jgi:hypothetical protein